MSQIRVLHIEDDPANRLLVRKILTGAGYEVIDAVDGLEGVRQARQIRPDLVLVDLNIPGLDGYEVTLRLRGDDSLSNVPIVAITADGDRSTSLAVGCDGFVQKPINARTFASTLQKFLRGNKEVVPPDKADARLRAQSQRIVARLEAKVAELSEANRRLREADKARTTFYRNVSHELATPMTPVVGYVKLLVDEELGPINPSQDKALRAMDDCVQRLRMLIDNLLDVTGLEAGTMRFVHRDYDVRTVVERALGKFQPAMAERSVQLALECPDQSMPAWGDVDRLTKGLTQVIDNAIKFTPHGGVIGVRVSRTGSHYRLCVADNGPGIPASQIDTVLQPFVQADGSPTRQHQGVGIGLAIARRVAEGLGGELSLSSPCNERIGGITFRGTTCTLTIAEHAPSLS
ncbi:MAG: hybrid sensor histidine kinase/response regulator [Sorangium cellulosum]|nr:MAG: hybrid sensor histidine kinase/response regulator [Sorangium cellulosum]